MKKVSITLDFWSDRKQRSYLCITGHYITEEFDYQSKILSFDSFYDRHQGVRIAKIVKEKLMELNIFHKLQSMTTDGASNMVSMYQALGNDSFDWFWCVAHKLHLVVINGLGFWSNKEKNSEKNISKTNNNNINNDNYNINNKNNYINNAHINNNFTTMNSNSTVQINDVDDPEDAETVWDDAEQGNLYRLLLDNIA